MMRRLIAGSGFDAVTWDLNVDGLFGGFVNCGMVLGLGEWFHVARVGVIVLVALIGWRHLP